jgi:hypothetical protein
MKKRDLCILVSSLLATGIDAVADEAPKRCPGNIVGAMGGGFTVDAAYDDALTAACIACDQVYDESCGPIIKSSYTDGWFWNTYSMTVQCEKPCPPVTCDDPWDECS